jgi:hypothetical protein
MVTAFVLGVLTGGIAATAAHAAASAQGLARLILNFAGVLIVAGGGIYISMAVLPSRDIPITLLHGGGILFSFGALWLVSDYLGHQISSGQHRGAWALTAFGTGCILLALVS